MAGINGKKWAMRRAERPETDEEYANRIRRERRRELKRIYRQDRWIRILRVPLFPFALIVKLYKWTYEID